jgi:hypothetical protein
MALKPTSSIRQPGASIDHQGEAIEVVTTGRHDPCVGIRATPIAEAMLALVLMDHWLRHRAQNAEVRSPTPAVTAPGKRLIPECAGCFDVRSPKRTLVLGVLALGVLLWGAITQFELPREQVLSMLWDTLLSLGW